MSDKTYNGWKNYETWAVSLWIDNDEGSYDYWKDQAEYFYKNAEANSYSTKKQQAAFSLADALKDNHEEQASEALPSSGLMSDLLSAALSEVDWFEIAEHMLEDYADNAPSEEEEDED